MIQEKHSYKKSTTKKIKSSYKDVIVEKLK